MCAAELGEYSVTAGDIVSMLPKAMTSLSARRNKEFEYEKKNH